MEDWATWINTIVGIIGIIVGVIGAKNISYAKKIINSINNVNNSTIQQAETINNGLSSGDVVEISQREAKKTTDQLIEEKIGDLNVDYSAIFEAALKDETPTR